MNRLVPLLLLLLAVWSPEAVAAEDRYLVGTATIETPNESHGRRFASELWFATAADAKVESFSPRLPLRPIAIARNAKPLHVAERRPLIVISHGNWGSRFSQGWLALELVRSGYVVLSTTHPGTAGDDQTVAGRYRLWDRSRDVSSALDAVLKDARWARLVDETRIGFVGHSFGGWTGVSLAGGLYDPVRQRVLCEKAARRDFYCEGTLEDDVTGVSAQDSGGSRTID